MKTRIVLIFLLMLSVCTTAQINTDRVMMIGRNALYFEDYVLSIQYFNQVINAKPYLHAPYFFRGLAKLNLEDYQGAEQDCSEAIGRNPFVVDYYQVRGLARINLGRYQDAISDYNEALVHAPENVGLWHNLILCKMREQDYEGAQRDAQRLIGFSPRYVPAYLMSAEVWMKQKDTLKAETCISQALEIDRYNPDTWSAKAILNLRQERYKEAEADLDEAIHLASLNAGNYINRALARYHQNNLRGAMNDYDRAVDMEPNNLIGLYNRGLLRAQVGDDNRAIEDFDRVIEMEPDNMMAIFNRGLLRDQTGDYQGAVADYTTVLDEYPDFMAGYQQRAAARRKIGDRRGAERDEALLLKAEIDRRNALAASTGNTSEADRKDDAREEEGKTRKKSNRNVKNYRKLVVADSEDLQQKYKNEYRGKVQNRNVKVEMEPMFVLAYYPKESEVKRSVNYHKIVDELNNTHILVKRLHITNQESPLDQLRIDEHFASIDSYSARIVESPNRADIRFARALDFYLVQDLSSAVDDLTQAVLLDGDFMPAYFNRALIRCKQQEYRQAEETIEMVATDLKTTAKAGEPRGTMGQVHEYELVRADLDKVIQLAPDFEYAYYNRAVLFCQQNDYHAAVVDFGKAIEVNPNFGEAYFNRGLTYIFLGQTVEGLADLSKAGELGLFKAYNIIKRYTDTEE